MSGHPQGGQYDDGYGQNQAQGQRAPNGQQGQDGYYHDDQYGQYHDDARGQGQYQQQGDAYYDESSVLSPLSTCLFMLTPSQRLL
jgi:1,3-beta-glucan synthase